MARWARQMGCGKSGVVTEVALTLEDTALARNPQDGTENVIQDGLFRS